MMTLKFIMERLLLFVLLWDLPPAAAQNPASAVEWRDDAGDTTTRATVHLLAKTTWPARVAINGDSCRHYRTGIFFKTVQLQQGSNTITATVRRAGGDSLTVTRTIFRAAPAPPRPAWPLWIDTTSVQPAQPQELLSGDRLRVSLTGARGHSGSVEFRPAKLRFMLRRSDYADYSRYDADIPLSRLPLGKPQQLIFELKGKSPEGKKGALRLEAAASVTVQAAEQLPLLRVTVDGALLNQNLGPVRLGAPVVAELPKGTLLTCSGRSGDNWRVRLDDRDEGWISTEEAEVVTEPALRPAYYITTLSASPAGSADVVTIPRLQPVPFTVHPDPAGRRLRIRLYGVKSSSTWITHRDRMRVVDRLTWEQIAPETYEVTVHLQTSQIWGYTLKPVGAALELRVKYPPQPAAQGEAALPAASANSGGAAAAQAPASPAGSASTNAARLAAADPASLHSPATALSPAAGLKIAIEAGHGGTNLGAVGLSGMEEKSVNLDVARRLETLCIARGMKVVQVRESDIDMSLAAKKDKIEKSDADLLVCIHANSGGTANGYLGANGTSTYYHNPFWGDFARVVYRRLLELPLQEFGCVGSFNYRIIRMTSRPAVLVELAFMSNAEDEERLFMEEFRQELASRILAGVEDFVVGMGK